MSWVKNYDEKSTVLLGKKNNSKDDKIVDGREFVFLINNLDLIQLSNCTGIYQNSHSSQNLTATIMDCFQVL